MIELVRAISSTFVHRFQNNMAKFFSLRSKSVICSVRLKAKVTLEGQMIKWSKIELVRAINSTFMHGF